MLCPWPRESPEVLARKLRSAALAPQGSCVRNLPNLPCAACVCVCVCVCGPYPPPPTMHRLGILGSGSDAVAGHRHESVDATKHAGNVTLV